MCVGTVEVCIYVCFFTEFRKDLAGMEGGAEGTDGGCGRGWSLVIRQLRVALIFPSAVYS